MPDPAAQLGATLGVLVRYGRDAVRDSVDALASGRATPEQQKIVHQLLLAITGK